MWRRIVKWLLWCLAVLVLMVSIAAAALWMMPWVVSTDWARGRIEGLTSRVLHAPVSVDGLKWTWKEGVQIHGLRIADNKAFSADPIIILDRLALKIDPAQLLDRRLSLDLDIEGVKAHLIRTEDGRTNLGAWLARLSPPGKPAEETQAPESGGWRDMALALPGDLTARIRLHKGALLAEDRQADRSLAIYDISLLADVPSLVHKPITITLHSEQEMGGEPLPPVDLTLSVKNLVDATPAIRLKTVSVDAHCTLPGLDLTLSGGLSDMGIHGRMDLDLATLTAAAGPLLPPGLPTVSGAIGWVFQAHMGPEEEIRYDTTLSGDGLMVSGGPLKEHEIGPVAFKFAQAGSVAPEKRALTIAKGDLRLQNNTRMGWEGRIRQADGSGMEADLSFADMALDLKALAEMAGPFLTMDITKGWSPEAAQGVTAEQVTISGVLPAGDGRVSVKGLNLDFPGLELARAKQGLSVKGVHLHAPLAEVRIEDRFPTSLDVNGDLAIQGIRLAGDQPVRMEGVKVSEIRLTGSDLVRSPKALLGVAGMAYVSESVRIERVDAPGLASITGLQHDLKVSARMQDQPPMIRLSAETVVEAPSPQLSALSKRPIKGGMRFGVQITDLDISSLGPLMADVGRLDGAARLGDVLDLRFTGEADDLGTEGLSLSGETRLDLKAAHALMPASLKPKGTFAGVIETDWRIDGRRPDPGDLKPVSDPEIPLRQRFHALGFLDTVRVTVNLTDVGLDLPLKEGASLSVHGIESPSPVKVGLSKGLRSVRLQGDLAIGRISGLPGIPPLQSPLQARLSVKVDQQDLSTLEISQSLRLDPLGIDQDLRMSVTQLGRLLNSKELPTVAALLKHLDVSVEAGLRTTLGPSLASFTPGLSLEGSLTAGIGCQLNGGRNISGRISLEGEGLDVTAGQARIKGLATHIFLSKSYGLQFEGDADGKSGPGSVPLSQKVLRPSPTVGSPPSSDNPLARRLTDDLGGSLAGPSTLAFDAVHIRTDPFPVDLRHGEVWLRLTDSLPSVDRFQVDAMTGSILGDLRVTRRDDLFALEMAAAFSGLDAAGLLAEPAPADRTLPEIHDHDTQVSGQVSLDMPVSRDPVRVMNHLSAGLRLTHIGSRMLERLLYAMDPYEANEGIVRQRAILRKGTPEWVDLQIRHGSLSLSGSVSAMGARIALPRVDRLNLASLPIHDRLQKVLGKLGPVEKGLQTLSADSILIGKDSSIRFVEKRR